MPALTRRRDPDRREERWDVFYGDVRVGSIGLRAGVPADREPWDWACGFWPGADPQEHKGGIAWSFEEARDAFECAWRVFLANRTEADFQA